MKITDLTITDETSTHEAIAIAILLTSEGDTVLDPGPRVRKALWGLADYVTDDEPQVTEYEGPDWKVTVETHDKMSPEAAAQLVSMCRMAYEGEEEGGLDRLVARIERMRSL